MPADPRGTVLYVGLEALPVRQRLLGGEHRLGVPRGEVLAVLRRAGLHDQRPSLRRSRQVERAPDPEMRANVVDGTYLGLVGPDPCCLVGGGGVIVPAVPELVG